MMNNHLSESRRAHENRERDGHIRATEEDEEEVWAYMLHLIQCRPTTDRCPLKLIVPSIDGVSEGNGIRNDRHSCRGVLDLAAQAVCGTPAPAPPNVMPLGYAS